MLSGSIGKVGFAYYMTFKTAILDLTDKKNKDVSPDPVQKIYIFV